MNTSNEVYIRLTFGGSCLTIMCPTHVISTYVGDEGEVIICHFYRDGMWEMKE